MASATAQKNCGSDLGVQVAESLGGFQFTNPNVAVADQVAVVLERERELFGRWRVRRATLVCSRAGQLGGVFHQDALVEDGHARGAEELSGGVGGRALEDH